MDSQDLPKMPGAQAQSDDESDADEPVWGRRSMKRISQAIIETKPSLPVSRRVSLNGGQRCAPRRADPEPSVARDSSGARAVRCSPPRAQPAASARRASSSRCFRRRRRQRRRRPRRRRTPPSSDAVRRACTHPAAAAAAAQRGAGCSSCRPSRSAGRRGARSCSSNARSAAQVSGTIDDESRAAASTQCRASQSPPLRTVLGPRGSAAESAGQGARHSP